MATPVQDTIDRIHQVCGFVERLARVSTSTEAMVLNHIVEKMFQGFFSFRRKSGPHGMDLEFVSKCRAIQDEGQNSFPCIKQDGAAESAPQQSSIALPYGGVLCPTDRGSTLRHNNHHTTSPTTFRSKSSLLSKRLNSVNSLGPGSSSLEDVGLYEKWSNGVADILNSGSDFNTPQDSPAPLPLRALAEVSSMYQADTCVGLYLLKSRFKQRKMIYRFLFGKLDVMEGQFTEPSGVAVNAQNDTVVADTNNHRIQIFDREGWYKFQNHTAAADTDKYRIQSFERDARFKFQHGECCKSDGQLLYPNRVALVRHSGDIVVTERSPTHQIQIYNQYRQLGRRFGTAILHHPRGVAVNPEGRMGIVDCKVMQIIIFEQGGGLLQRFGCFKRLELLRVKLSHLEAAILSAEAQRCLSSSLPTTFRGSGTTAGAQLGSPASLPEAFTAPSADGEKGSGGSPSDSGSVDSAALPQLSTKCSLYHETCTVPKVLKCLHTCCQPCLKKECTGDRIRSRCPRYIQDTPVPTRGMAGLPSDYAASNLLGTVALGGASLRCSSCKAATCEDTGPFAGLRRAESSTVACFAWANFLCPNCVMAHQFMHCFEGHQVLMRGERQSMCDGLQALQDKLAACLRHRLKVLRCFCPSCDLPVCKAWPCSTTLRPRVMLPYKLFGSGCFSTTTSDPKGRRPLPFWRQSALTLSQCAY